MTKSGGGEALARGAGVVTAAPTPPEPSIADPDFTLYVGDVCSVLDRLDLVSVDAIVTSPPYLDVRPDVESRASVAEYAAWSEEWLRRLRFVLFPAGSLMPNLGRVHRGGIELRWHEPILDAAERAGFVLLDTIVWHKVNGGGGKKSPYLLDRHELVYWLALRTDPYKGFDEARQPYAPATLARYKRRWGHGSAAVKGGEGKPQDGRQPHPDGAKPGSVFTSSVGADKGTDHPTPMATDLAEFLIQLACVPGGLVLDPFGGACTTAVAARTLGRRSICIELHDAHVPDCARRLVQQSLLSQP